MRISQHLRSLSYYSDDAEQVPDAAQDEHEPPSDIKQNTMEQPQSAASLAPKICLTRDGSIKDKSSHSITRSKLFMLSAQLQLDLG